MPHPSLANDRIQFRSTSTGIWFGTRGSEVQILSSPPIASHSRVESLVNPLLHSLHYMSLAPAPKLELTVELAAIRCGIGDGRGAILGRSVCRYDDLNRIATRYMACHD
jgi:hypothetical protein